MSEPVGSTGNPYYTRPGVGAKDNLLGIESAPELLAEMHRRFEAAEASRSRQPPDRATGEDIRGRVQQLHGMFDGLFKWAREFRKIDMPDLRPPGDRTHDHRGIGAELDALSAQLRREGGLRDLDAERWPDRAAYFTAAIVRAKPFYDGNYEVAKMFAGQLASAAGHNLDWTRMSERHARAVLTHADLTPHGNQPLRDTLAYGIGHTSTHPATPQMLSERTPSRFAGLRQNVQLLTQSVRPQSPKPSTTRSVDVQAASDTSRRAPPVGPSREGLLNRLDSELENERRDLAAGRTSPHTRLVEADLDRLPRVWARPVAQEPQERSSPAPRPDRRHHRDRKRDARKSPGNGAREPGH